MSRDRTVFSPNATPVFIAGAPRSGTTLLTAAVNTHPQILITNELRPFILFNNIRRQTGKPSENLPEHPLRRQFRATLLQTLPNFLRDFYRAEVTKDNLGCPAECGDSVVQEIRAYGDKNPGYADTHATDCLDYISETIPDAKFIHIHRDPRACVASYKAIPVYSNDIDRCIDNWKRHTGSMVALRERLGPDRVMEIRYEDFVTKKGDKIFRALETFLGVDHAIEPIRFLARERVKPIPYRSPTTPMEKLGTPNWEAILDAAEIESVLADTAELRSRLANCIWTEAGGDTSAQKG